MRWRLRITFRVGYDGRPPRGRYRTKAIRLAMIDDPDATDTDLSGRFGVSRHYRPCKRQRRPPVARPLLLYRMDGKTIRYSRRRKPDCVSGAGIGRLRRTGGRTELS
jgi:hypothetical protein